ncbi:response regulator transcription factor [Paenibacillus montanisoli]|uniref:DNA-binding response regulator n=1 Tax=Paenibacillus montanisoli TaxID=2081970 RepID=A0A328U495_9BACL|nr:response regulator transcription factor [Paenibacillus montanisoli]RAP77440.1 DNA-binding response regulator [Paenibacillus montanisoli]
MRKAILVDDERFARKGLVGLIPWEQCGFEIVCEAEDGEEALSLIEQHKPDLVITDIRMPVVDGLELIQTVQERLGKSVKFIIISGYGDFKYAQQAVRFGVQDYLLKPIDEVELMETLQRISTMLDQTPNWPIEGHSILQASLFEQLITGNADEKALTEAGQFLSLPGDKPLRYISLEVNDLPDGFDEERRSQLMEQLKADIEPVLKRLIPEQVPVIYARNRWEIGMLVRSGPNSAWAAELGNEIAEASSKRLDETGVPRVYVGAEAARLCQVKQSYATAMDLYRYKYTLDGKLMIQNDETNAIPLQFKELDPSLYTELLVCLEEQDINGVIKLVDAMFSTFQEKRIAWESMSSAIARCVHRATHVIQTMQGDESMLASLKPIMQWHQEPRTLQGVKRLLIAFLTECMAYIVSLRSTTMKGDIGKIRSYIEANYASNISLKSISKHFYMNSVYLGQLFKKTYGVYFNDFLLQIRIQEAKRQLRQTDKKIYEVAASVGFGNPDYFVSQFEKVEGKTPTEYKNAMLAKT